jgi:acyl-CoA thioesterase FadM
VTTEHELRAGGEVVARAEATLVHLTDGDPTPLPAEWRAALQ